MRGSPAPSSASSSASDLSRSPAHSRSDLRPGTSGDYSLSASLSACTLLSEVPLRALREAALRGRPRPWPLESSTSLFRTVACLLWLS